MSFHIALAVKGAINMLAKVTPGERREFFQRLAVELSDADLNDMQSMISGQQYLRNQRTYEKSRTRHAGGDGQGS